MEQARIITTAAACGIHISEQQAELLKQYYYFLMAENKKYNLTRITGEKDALYELFIDSLTGTAAMGCPGRQLLDLGSGGGLPGVPLKIIFPQLQLSLVESSTKKINFLRKLAAYLKLAEISFLPVRAEELGQGAGREAYTWVTARAVAPLVTLAELALPLVCRGGWFWAFKGSSAEAELAEADEIIARCGGLLRKKFYYQLPHRGIQRCILVFEKTGKTEQRFPRKSGLPRKRPFYGKQKICYD